MNDDEQIRGDKRKLTQLRDHEERGPNGNRLETIYIIYRYRGVSNKICYSDINNGVVTPGVQKGRC